MMYCIHYENSKQLKVTTTAMMCKRDIQLGVIHVHKLFKLPTEENLTPHRQAELSILNLMKNPKEINSQDLFTCYHFMKWFNAQQKISNHLTSSLVISVIATYTWVKSFSYFLWIIHRSNQYQVIHF